ncbi:MAG: c-type cytochrome [Acidobacteria bacterium]|nr:c-type cytochrome [Chloroflexota bacterium]MYN65888.1 c-type cytochrome [Acidobacteriota bacterium]
MRRVFFVGLIQAALVAALVVVAGPAAPAEAQENPYETLIDVRMGERVFRAQCGRCHGRDGRGNDETGAPDLTTGQFSRVSSDAGMFDVIRDGIDGTAMIGISPRASDQSVWQIVSYINSLNLDPADYDLPGDAGRGEQVYAGANCSTCHMVRGEGGRTGPDLSTVGSRLDPDEITTSLSDPDAEVAPRWWTMRINRADGSTIEGLRMNEDTFTVRIMDNDENLWSFMKSEVRSLEQIKTSTMPAAEGLNASEMDDLVAYLFSLRRES